MLLRRRMLVCHTFGGRFTYAPCNLIYFDQGEYLPQIQITWSVLSQFCAMVFLCLFSLKKATYSALQNAFWIVNLFIQDRKFDKYKEARLRRFSNSIYVRGCGIHSSARHLQSKFVTWIQPLAPMRIISAFSLPKSGKHFVINGKMVQWLVNLR